MERLIQKEMALHQIETRTNRDKVVKLLHPEFKEVGKSGTTFDFESIISAMESDQPAKSKIHSQDYECIELDSCTCLLLYRSAVINVDSTITSYTKRSSVWVKTQEDWKLRYHQGTACSEFQLN